MINPGARPETGGIGTIIPGGRIAIRALIDVIGGIADDTIGIGIETCGGAANACEPRVAVGC